MLDKDLFMWRMKPLDRVSSNEKQKSKFQIVAKTQEEEDAFDIAANRSLLKPCSVTLSVANLVKSALGAGVLSGHMAYMKAGCWVALAITLLIGCYYAYCLHILVKSAHVLYKRTNVASMTYPDIGEAAFTCSSSPRLQRWAKSFRYTIDVVICLNMFGSCACYQIIVSKSIKQLVENTWKTGLEPQVPGYPNLRVYLAVLMLPFIMICLLRHLQWLAPFSVVGNCFIAICIATTVYYAFENNPKFENLVAVKDLYGFISFCGMAMFTMSCAGVAISVENNMKEPSKFSRALCIGMILITLACICISWFGYAAFLEDCVSPITVNFPMTLFPKLLKGGIIIMIYVTHALNFWVPLNLTFYYLKKYHPPENEVRWEIIYRAVFVTLIGMFAIAFPSVESVMGFLGTFCLTNMAIIWPNLIELVVIWERPGLGKFKWRLWKAVVLIFIGCILFAAGTYVNGRNLLQSATKSDLSP